MMMMISTVKNTATLSGGTDAVACFRVALEAQEWRAICAQRL